jgi:Ca-activated chloride channel family protein
VDELKYQAVGVEGRKSKVEGREERALTDAGQSGELLTLKLRYKEPEGETSKLLEYPLKDRGHSFHSASPDLQFAAAVASFGMILRNSQHRGSTTLEGVAEIASAALGKDEGGYRAEFVDLVRKAQAIGAK